MVDTGSERESEYDVQLFGFSVEDFMTAFKSLFEDEVSRLTTCMASSLTKKYSQDAPEIKLVQEIKSTLIKQYMHKAKEPLDTLKGHLKSLIHIPPHVLLPEDAAQQIQYSAEEEQELDKELKDLYERLKRARALKIEVQQELKLLQEVVPDLNKRVEEMERAVAAQRVSEEGLRKLEPVVEKIVDKSKKLEQLDAILDSEEGLRKLEPVVEKIVDKSKKLEQLDSMLKEKLDDQNNKRN